MQDFLALRAKYRDVFLQAWTPADFNSIGCKCRWNSNLAMSMVDELEDAFDAEHGTNWYQLKLAHDAVRED